MVVFHRVECEIISDQVFFSRKMIKLMQGLLCTPSSMRDKAKLSVKPEDPASGFSTRKQKADVAFSNLLHIFSISSEDDLLADIIP